MNFEFNTLTLLILFGIGAVGLLFCHSRISEASREIREISARVQENLDRRLLETNDRHSAETRGLRDSVMSLNERMTRIQDEVSDTLEEARGRIIQEALSEKEDQEKRMTFFGNLVETTRKELFANLDEKSRQSAEQHEKTLESLNSISSELTRVSGLTRDLPHDAGERLRVLEKFFQEQAGKLDIAEEALSRTRENLQELSSSLTSQLGALDEKSRKSVEQNEKTLESLNSFASELARIDGLARDLSLDAGQRLQALEKLFQEQVGRLDRAEETLSRDQDSIQEMSSGLVSRFGALERDLRSHFENRLKEFYQQVEEALSRDRDSVQELSARLVSQFGALERDLRSHFENRLKEFYQQVGQALHKSEDLERQILRLADTMRESFRENIQAAAGKVFALIGKASEEAFPEDALSLAGFREEPAPEPELQAPREERAGTNRYSHLFRK